MTDLLSEFLVSELHRAFESLVFVRFLLPPHRVEATDSIPQSTVDVVVAFAFADFRPIIVGVHRKDEPFVDAVAQLLLNLSVDHRLERKRLLPENSLHHIGDNFLEMKVYQSRRRQLDLEVRMSARKLSLVVVEPFGRLVTASHINNNIALFQLLLVTRPYDLRSCELFRVFGEHHASENLVAVEHAVVSAHALPLLLHR